MFHLGYIVGYKLYLFLGQPNSKIPSMIYEMKKNICEL